MKKAKYISFVLIISILYIFVLTGCSKGDERLNHCVKVITSLSEGQGVVWKIDRDEVLIVTAGHVIEGVNDGCSVCFINNHVATAEILENHTEEDVALLKVSISDVDEKTMQRIKAVKPSKFVTTGAFEPVEADSFDLYLDNSRYIPISGQVDSLKSYVYDLDAEVLVGSMEVKEGMSGGGIFDREGGLLGIIQAGNTEENLIGISYLDIFELLGR